MAQGGTPIQGEMLVGRYRLDTPVPTAGPAGRSVWNGTDTTLRRPVTIEMQIPGGRAAKELIGAAVTAGRIEHPGVAGVYDAVNEPGRAFVVREWVAGVTLAQLVADEPLPPQRAAAIIRDVADAVASIHGIGFAHAALSPDVIIVNADSDVTVTGLKPHAGASLEHDVRAIGGLLYAALTAHWPAELGQHSTLPDAIRVDGRLCSPRQVRAGIPTYLDALTMDLLDPTIAAPSAGELAGELRRYDVTDPDLSALSAFATEPPAPARWWSRFIIPVGAVACIVAAGIVLGLRGLPNFASSSYPISDDPTKRQSSDAGPRPLAISNADILDPQGNGSELDGANRTIDGNGTTYWATEGYPHADFGVKNGMGVLLDLGSEQSIQQVTASLTAPGGTVELRASPFKGGSADAFTAIGTVQADAPQDVTFSLDKPVKTRYVLLWISRLAPMGGGDYGYALGVNEVTVLG